MANASTEVAEGLIAHGVDLLRVEGRERRQILALLKRLEIDLVAAIGDIDPTGPVQPTYRQMRLQRLLQQTRETIRSAYRGAGDTMAGELLELADIEAGFARRAMNTAVGVDIADAALTRGQLRALVRDTLIEGAPSKEWWSRQAGDTAQRFADQMRAGIAAGETNADLVRRVRGQATGRRSTYWQGPKGDLSAFQVEGFRRRQFVDFAGGLMDTSTRNAEALVRTSVQAVANEARLATYRENGDMVKAVQWLSVLDQRTSQWCIPRDGLTWTLDGTPIGHDVPFQAPPIHFNCRSTLSPVLRSADEVFGRRMGDLPPSTRASMDGQVPETTTFDAFLKGKPETFQNELLGTGKAGLWRKGDISLRDLLDQRGRPLTLEQLRARV